MTARVSEAVFQSRLRLALGRCSSLRQWPQKNGLSEIESDSGVTSTFRAGPPKGAADLTGIVIPEGWRLEVEVKAEGGRLSAHQKKWRDNMAAFGAVYALVDWDTSLDLAGNLARGVGIVEGAIAARRTRVPA